MEDCQTEEALYRLVPYARSATACIYDSARRGSAVSSQVIYIIDKQISTRGNQN